MSRRRAAGAGVLLVLLFAALLWPRSKPPRPRRAAPPPSAPLSIRTEPDGPRPRDEVDADALPGEVPEDERLAGQGIVRISVQNDRGEAVEEAEVWSEDCLVQVRVREVQPVDLPAPVGKCSFYAERKDGLLSAHSPVGAVVVTEGQVAELTLVLPADPIGGIGIGISPVAEGMMISWLHPGGPGQDAGLHIGEVVVAVDDASVAGLGARAFIARATGPVGSRVRLRIRDGVDTADPGRDLSLRRDTVPDLLRLPEAEAAPLRAEALEIYLDALQAGAPVQLPGPIEMAIAQDPNLFGRLIDAQARLARPPG